MHLTNEQLLELNEEGLLTVCTSMVALKSSVTSLVSIEVLQSIAR